MSKSVIKLLAATLVASSIFISCNNDDSDDGVAVSPCHSISLTETLSSDVQEVKRTQNFLFNNGLISSYESRQSYNPSLSGRAESEDLVQSTQVDRDGDIITMTDSYGNVSRYELGKYGLATNCIRTEAGGTVRTYTFDYIEVNGHYMLHSLNESINDEPFSAIYITYNGSHEMRVVRNMNDEAASYTVKFSGDGVVANDYKLPSLFLAEMHPFSLHLPALYGCLLGYPGKLLGGTVTPDDNLYNETVAYTYTADEDGIPTKCVVKTTNNGGFSTRTIDMNVK